MKIIVLNSHIVINADKELEDICVVVPGKWKGHPAGDYSITESDIKQILNNYEIEKRELLFDYDHESLFGKSVAAGWGSELYEKEGKVYAKVNWTPKAKEAIKNEEYRYLSNVIIFNYQDSNNPRISGTYLHSVALTNVPFQKEVPAIINKIQNIGGKVDNELEKILGKLNAKTPDEAVSKIEQMQEQIKTLNNQILANEIDLAIAEGKLLPADKEVAISLRKNSKELDDVLGKLKEMSK